MLKLTSLWSYHLPLNNPLPLKRGIMTHREGLLLFLSHPQGGDDYWTEVAPLPGWSQESLEDCVNWLRENQANLSETAAKLPAISWGLSLAQPRLNKTLPHALDLNALLTATEPEELRQETHLRYAEGYRVFKLKVGRFTPAQDKARIEAVLQGLGPMGRLRLDANRSWDLKQALAVVEHCQDLPLLEFLTYIEEPLQNTADLPAFYRASQWPVALDESLNQPGLSADIWEICTAIVLKPMLLGRERTFDWLKRAKKSGKAVTISSSFESPWGLSQLAFWAAQQAPGQAAGLDTWRVFQPQPDLPPWEITHGQLILQPKMLDKPLFNAVYLNKMKI